ncbi:hypothetical protein BKA62DRAFT_764618 [Auriculariales sp. MPI-PUGE-AT-0066]|nr:hypothetical protein BKA62DRAFT_764618 [Auriculariales sp. MPI-PUGE-AT-0066]
MRARAIPDYAAASPAKFDESKTAPTDGKTAKSAKIKSDAAAKPQGREQVAAQPKVQQSKAHNVTQKHRRVPQQFAKKSPAAASPGPASPANLTSVFGMASPSLQQRQAPVPSATPARAPDTPAPVDGVARNAGPPKGVVVPSLPVNPENLPVKPPVSAPATHAGRRATPAPAAPVTAPVAIPDAAGQASSVTGSLPVTPPSPPAPARREQLPSGGESRSGGKPGSSTMSGSGSNASTLPRSSNSAPAAGLPQRTQSLAANETEKTPASSLSESSVIPSALPKTEPRHISADAIESPSVPSNWTNIISTRLRRHTTAAFHSAPSSASAQVPHADEGREKAIHDIGMIRRALSGPAINVASKNATSSEGTEHGKHESHLPTQPLQPKEKPVKVEASGTPSKGQGVDVSSTSRRRPRAFANAITSRVSAKSNRTTLSHRRTMRRRKASVEF